MADAKQQQAAAPTGVWKTIKPFVNGGASGMLATCVIQPIDMIKVKIQLGEGSAAQVAKTMYANEGLGSFYKGLSAGLLRQADSTLPAAQRRHYKNAFHALYRITADEGVLALWKGAGEYQTVIGASAISGFCAAACSLPFDYVKTQIQKMQPDATGKYPYTGSLDCAMQTLKTGGPFKFYSGFPVYCVRIAPHVMMTWLFLNQIQKYQKKIGI
ncbi:unnamed protein product [Triticum turgidum subsp. durum]|uniref:Uncharacterized protein n=1 Tax=Triticum turgidum subsp. durum TaxID=4567 RepID=A0A9R0Q5U6_TRITD|nr:unnamed protein product [Triticum turgidum subsp. durum]